MKHQTVPIEKIHIGNRFRQDLGDLDSLAQNIDQMGLLQPIIIDPYFDLIAGYRRYHACAFTLHWKEIPCVVIDLDSAIEGEYAENVFRKDFTPSERKAIGEAIERRMKRQGARTDLPAKEGKSDFPANAGRSKHEREAVDIAAKRAGFKSRDTYRRVKKAVDKGAPETIAAMDQGDISIDAAAVIATQPKDKEAHRRTPQRQAARSPADHPGQSS